MKRYSLFIIVLASLILISIGSGYCAPAQNENPTNTMQKSTKPSAEDRDDIGDTAPTTAVNDTEINDTTVNITTALQDTEEPELDPNKIEVCTTEQKIYIYSDDTLLKRWTVATGKNNSTPLGNFTVETKGEWFFSEKYQEGAKWWVSFKDWGVYLFHSIPMDRQKNIIPEEADKLGFPASHGCIRLETDHAKWIYDHIPEGTPVCIY